MTPPPYKLAIFDVDGTLTEIKPEVRARQPKLSTPNQLGEQQPRPSVVEKLAELRANGMRFALATNRGGVAFGYTSYQTALAIVQEAAQLCGIPDALIYVCPYHAKANGPRANQQYARDSDCRKPKPGMLLEAMQAAGVTPQETFFVGDYETDYEAAKNAGVDYFWADLYFGFDPALTRT